MFYYFLLLGLFWFFKPKKRLNVIMKIQKPLDLYKEVVSKNLLLIVCPGNF